MVACLEEAAAKASPPFQVATGTELAEFNAKTNTRGEEFLALVVDSVSFSESVSFREVRRLYLGDVPTSASSWQQQCGRASRMFGHHRLDPEERDVTVVVPTAVLPAWMRTLTGAWAYRAFCSVGCEAAQACDSARQLLRQFEVMKVHTLEDLKAFVDEEACRARGHHSAEERVPLSKTTMARILRKLGLCTPKRLQLPKRQKLFLGLQVNTVGTTTLQDADTEVPKHLRQLAQELQSLYLAKDAGEVAKGLATCTADELAVQSLVAELSAQVPALAEFRRLCIDCDCGEVDTTAAGVPCHPGLESEIPGSHMEWASADEASASESELNASRAFVARDGWGKPSSKESLTWNLDVRARRTRPLECGDVEEPLLAATGSSRSLKRLKVGSRSAGGGGRGDVALDEEWVRALDEAAGESSAFPPAPSSLPSPSASSTAEPPVPVLPATEVEPDGCSQHGGLASTGAPSSSGLQLKPDPRKVRLRWKKTLLWPPPPVEPPVPAAAAAADTAPADAAAAGKGRPSSKSALKRPPLARKMHEGS